MRIVSSEEAPLAVQRLASEEVLARRIKAERIRRGLSQEKFAERVEAILGGGFPQSAVSKIERERGRGQRRAITVSEGLAISQVLEIPLLELLLPPEVVANDVLRRLILEMIEAGRRAAEADREFKETVERIISETKSKPAVADEMRRAASDPKDGAVFRSFMWHWAGVRLGEEPSHG